MNEFVTLHNVNGVATRYQITRVTKTKTWIRRDSFGSQRRGFSVAISTARLEAAIKQGGPIAYTSVSLSFQPQTSAPTYEPAH